MPQTFFRKSHGAISLRSVIFIIPTRHTAAESEKRIKLEQIVGSNERAIKRMSRGKLVSLETFSILKLSTIILSSSKSPRDALL